MKKIILLIIIVVVLFLAGCMVPITTPEITESNALNKTPVVTENNALNDCFSKIDQAPGESYVQYQKDLCRLSVAKESRSQGLCSSIDNENKKEECNKYFDELPFVEGTATRDNILDKCECTYYCYGVKYKLDCIYKNVQTPQQCQSFMGLHYSTDFEGKKKYFEEGALKTCLRDLMERQSDVCFCNEYPHIYAEVCEENKKDDTEKNLFKVKDVIDGETLELENGEKVRLIGISAPKKGEPYSQEAKDRLKDILTIKSGCYGFGHVTLEKESNYGNKDINGNLIRYAYGGSGYDWDKSHGGLINAVLAYEGLVKFYLYDNYQSGIKNEIENLQAVAMEEKKGLWVNPNESYERELKNIKEEIDYIICSADVYDCSDFNGQEEANIVFDSCSEHGDGDIHNLAVNGAVCN